MRKVRAFLNGFRLAEVHRVGRIMADEILDKLAVEGMVGLDVTLATITKVASTPALTSDSVPWSGIW